MVTKETLQNYADTVFAGLSPEAPTAERNLNNGKFDLHVGANGTLHTRSFDENMVNSDMEQAVRALRDELFPPVVAEEIVEVAAPATDPAPPPEPPAEPEPEVATRPDPAPAPPPAEPAAIPDLEPATSEAPTHE